MRFLSLCFYFRFFFHCGCGLLLATSRCSSSGHASSHHTHEGT
jgi:hypothetical protein